MRVIDAYAVNKALAPWLSAVLGQVLAGLWFVGRFALAAWASLAIYYSNLPWFWLRFMVMVAFAAFSVWALGLKRRPLRRLAWAGLFGLVLLWEISIAPSHHRLWRPEVAVLPRSTVEGDRVWLTGVRDFDYRSVDEFTVRYGEREVSLAHLTSVDFFISYWTTGPVAHTFVSFNFDNARSVCISIEIRPEEGESFSPIASLFKQFELIYVVGEERDLVRVRTNYRHEEVFLYPIHTSSAAARRLFLVYLARINELADHPQWYDLLRNNCTINIVRYANAAGRKGRFDIRFLLNGWSDRYLYRAGLVNTSIPFDTLRQRSRITEMARDAEGAPEFSDRIRSTSLGE